MTIDTQKLRDGPYLRDGKETMRIMNEAADALDAQAAEIARLREVLTAIEQWEIPLVESRGEAVPMSVAYGSNGVRDYFRGVARAALSGESKC